jgi:hypothetical protein
MTASALFLGVLGIPCVFAPDIVLTRFAGGTSAGAEILVQLTGALYAGFGALNWMSKGSLMGGIYGRPVAIGNLLHFVAGGFALIKSAPTLGQPALAWPVAIGYALFAVGFALVVFRNPLVNPRENA